MPTAFFSTEAPGCIHTDLPIRLAPTGDSLHSGFLLLVPIKAIIDYFSVLLVFCQVFSSRTVTEIASVAIKALSAALVTVIGSSS